MKMAQSQHSLSQQQEQLQQHQLQQVVPNVSLFSLVECDLMYMVPTVPPKICLNSKAN